MSVKNKDMQMNCTKDRGSSNPVSKDRRLRSAPLWAGGLTLLLLLSPHASAQHPPKKSPPVEKRFSDVEKEVSRLIAETDVYTTEHLREPLLLCDKKVFLSREDNRERFEREFFQLLENKGLLHVIVKRYLKFYPMINGEIQRAGMPADLIYLMVTESYLNPRSLSKANAAGMWQFIKETGKREGLFISDHVDERYNVKKATRSALAHLRRLNGEFGDWLLTMAAYNAGAGRIREAVQNQESTDFFQLFLPEETERYIFRILALKEIITDHERFGIYIDDKMLYKPVQLAEVALETDQETHINIFAKSMDLPFRTFRMYNLHLRKYRLPKGVYTVNVPFEKKDIFLKRLRAYPSVTVLGAN
jgi:hypothetical protein